MLINVLVAGWLVDELLVTALHGDVPHVVPDVLRPAVRGPVDVVLGVAHDAEKSADDAQRQHGLQPVEPHREPDGETADGDGAIFLIICIQQFRLIYTSQRYNFH